MRALMTYPRHRILLLVENLSDRETYQRFLREDPEKQFDVVVAESAEHASALCQSSPPDCVVIEQSAWEAEGSKWYAPPDDRPGAWTAVVLVDRLDERLSRQLIDPDVGGWLVKSQFDTLQLRLVVHQAVHRREQQRQLQACQSRLRQRGEEFDQFASIVSHDLTAPARRVDGFCQLLARRYADRLDEEAREFLEFLTAESARLQRLIGYLLDYSRLSTRQQPKARADSDQVLREVLEKLDTKIRACAGQVTSDPLPTVTADRSQLALLLHHLIDNGLKFRGDRAPAVHVDCQPAQSEWVFCVRDNGRGVDPQQHHRLFQVFQQLRAEDQDSGAGIGLAMCKKIVELHGGRIWVESEPDQGSRFYFTLPMP